MARFQGFAFASIAKTSDAMVGHKASRGKGTQSAKASFHDLAPEPHQPGQRGLLLTPVRKAHVFSPRMRGRLSLSRLRNRLSRAAFSSWRTCSITEPEEARTVPVGARDPWATLDRLSLRCRAGSGF